MLGDEVSLENLYNIHKPRKKPVFQLSHSLYCTEEDKFNFLECDLPLPGFSMRISIVHDWLTTYAGAERVLEQILLCFPDADLFSLVDFLPPEQRGFIQNKRITTSFIQRLPLARTKYRSYLPLMPLAVEQFDLSGYDLVISSSHAVAKGVITGPDQLHICMCYSPIRYAWDLQHQYLGMCGWDKGLKGLLARYMLHRIRMWDQRTANSVDQFIAISEFIARRIYKVYRRDSTVVYPPVDVESFPLCQNKEDFYLTASRLVPYKRVDLIVEAFSRIPEKKLVVIGEGPEFSRIKTAAGDNVEFLGYQPGEVLRDYMQRARAFIFAAEEDFGIAPLEAQACGTPVIAFGKGGALETIHGLDANIPTGVFFYRQGVADLTAAVEQFDENQGKILPKQCRQNALRFDAGRFRKEFTDLVEGHFETFKTR
jgi:glycosyltransferase involved in cell wall biosynthesis